MTDSLTGRRVIVAGVANELTAFICLRLAMEGLHVIGISSDQALLQQTAHEVRDVHGRFDYAVHFSQDAVDVMSKSARVAEEYGGVDSVVFLASDELPASPEWTRDPDKPARRWAQLQELFP